MTDDKSGKDKAPPVKSSSAKVAKDSKDKTPGPPEDFE